MHHPRPKILLLGEFRYGTGFDRVARHLIRAANPDFEVHMYALGYAGEPAYVAPGVHLHPAKSTRRDRHGAYALAHLANEIQPQLLFVFYDLTFLRFQLEGLRLFRNRIPIIAYPALDGHIYKRRKLISTLKPLHTCVWFTEFARDQVRQALTEQPSLLSRPLRQTVIPHGVDTTAFHPLASTRFASRAQARSEVFPDLPDRDLAFIVMNGNRPHARKRHDLTLAAFAQFAAGKPENVYLYLHLSSGNATSREQFRKQAQKLGIGDRLLMGPPREAGPVDDRRLNHYYNATDVGINTTTGEGWGLVSCEHGAAGVPQIVPRHSSHPEIWADAALYLEPGSHAGDNTQSVWQAGPIDPAAAAAHLERLYRDVDFRHTWGTRAEARMRDPYFGWDTIEATWRELLHAVLMPQPSIFIHP